MNESHWAIYMIPRDLAGILASNPAIMSGAVCFRGTRVPVQALLDTIDDGDTVEDFLAGFPDVTYEQAQAVVRWEQGLARQALGMEAGNGAHTA